MRYRKRLRASIKGRHNIAPNSKKDERGELHWERPGLGRLVPVAIQAAGSQKMQLFDQLPVLLRAALRAVASRGV